MHTKRRRWALILGLWVALLPACRREPESVRLVVDAREKKPPTPAAAANTPASPVLIANAPAAPVAAALPEPSAAPTPEPTAPPPPAAAGNVEYATVELSGTIELPPGSLPKEPLFVFIAAGDCLNAAAPLLRRLPVTDNRAFFAAVMVPQSSTLSLCAAAEPAPGQPAHLYGRAGTLPIQKAADQTFRDLKITLNEDTPRRFATPVAR